MSQYARFKRKNQTIFLYVEPSDKISDTVQKIAKINEKSPDQVQLIFDGAELENDKATEDYKIENDSVVYFVYKKDGSDDWEEVDVEGDGEEVPKE